MVLLPDSETQRRTSEQKIDTLAVRKGNIRQEVNAKKKTDLISVCVFCTCAKVK